MAATRVLLLGASGKVARLMIPLMLNRGWKVFGVVRNPDYVAELKALGSGVEVLVESLEQVNKAADAQRVIDATKPDYVVWSAGAGGKGGPERTFAIDRDAAKAYIEAASTTKSVKKFLMVSYNGSRRNKPSWWSDEEWKKYQEVNQGALKNYYIAKVEADEALQAWSKKRQRNDPAFQAINLRPGTLTDEKGTGRISLGKIHALSKISRADVADVAVRLLERDDTSGYFDLLQGEEATPDAIDRVVSEKIDAFEGEDAHRIYGLVA